MTSRPGGGRLRALRLPAQSPLSTPLEANLLALRQALSSATLAAGREPEAVHLLAVTKSVSPELAAALARLGQHELGENRLEGLSAKHAHLAAEGLAVRWHFIGKLQRNKARRVVRLADEIHSVDSLRLLQTLDRVAAEEQRRPRVHLEVKLSEDEEKHGLSPAELREAVLAAVDLEHLELVGLMTLATRPGPGVDAAAAAREEFETLARLARELEDDAATRAAFQAGRVRLSMGMSGDWTEAVAAGSDMIRIGTALFVGVEDPGRTRHAGGGAA